LVEKKRVVILVEDDPSVLRALRRLMIYDGFEVRAFARPSAVLEIDTKIPDSNACLIFDVHLPEMTGVELYEKLAASGCRLPVIVITGHVDQATLALTERINAAGVLIKPFSRDTLLAAITKAFAVGRNPS
jgi:two-component system response regulator FixJ